MIYVARITKVTAPLPSAPEGAINLNCLSWFPNNTYQGVPLYELTPYFLRDEDGVIFENVWQSSKVYGSVQAQHEIKAGKVIWSHPSEVHVDQNNQVNAAYWNWRHKLRANPFAVRYPNGYHGRHTCRCCLWLKPSDSQDLSKEGSEKPDGTWLALPYIPARKEIYCKTYARLVQQTSAFKQLQALVDAGTSIQICEMDVRPGPITLDILKYELHNPAQPFGHGYVLAACLLGVTHIFDE